MRVKVGNGIFSVIGKCYAFPAADTLPTSIIDKMWIKCLVCFVLHTYPGVTQATGPRRRSTDDLIPCERGWFYFRNKCYKLEGKTASGRQTQEKASAKCSSEGGKLATIESKAVNDFLVTYLLLEAKENAWIGLHDRINESIYTWDDGYVTNYTNWEPLEPTEKNDETEDCVEIVFRSLRDGGMSGQWNDVSCSHSRAYICESEKSKKLSPDPRFCLGEQGGWKFQNSCYHVVYERKSWDDAEQHCRNIYNGHLLTILDFTVDLFLEHILSIYNREVWIGIKIQEQSLQQWTSGWFVGFSEWDKDLGEDFVFGTCSLRSKNKMWKRVPCSKAYSFVCETSSVGPPVLKQPAKGAQCPDIPEDWFDLGGEYCYFIDTKNKLNWYQANFNCNKRGGYLVSIHSAEESLILHQFIKYTQNSIYIGLHSLTGYENMFVWSDGSPLDYKNWDNNEPNKVDEECGEVWSCNMKWNDANCEDKKGYICSVKKVSPNVTETSSKSDCTDGVSFQVLTGVVACILLVVILIGIVIYCFRQSSEQRKKNSSGIQSPSTGPSTPLPRPRYRSADIIIRDNENFYESG